MLSCTEISFVICFQFGEIRSQTLVSFYATQSSYLLKTWGGKEVIFTLFFFLNIFFIQNMIPEQSSIIQYA